MFSAFRDEIEKLANPRRKSNYHATDLTVNSKIESMHQWLARPEVHARIQQRYSAAPRSAANKDLDTAVARAAKAPVPAPAVKAEAAGGKLGSKVLNFIGDHKKLFGAVGGVAAGGALAATMVKLLKKKAPAPAPATPTNDQGV